QKSKPVIGKIAVFSLVRSFQRLTSVIGCLYAPTEIAVGAVAGAPIVQSFGPSFPLATTTITPCSVALFTALLVGKSGTLIVFPSDKFNISTPSSNAFSIAAITWTEVPKPFGPNARYA